MTDNEIIKALKIRLREGGCNGDCPLLELGYCFDCACVPDEVARDVLDLINRQKEEIERLGKELELANADKVIAETHEKSAKEMFVDVTQQIKTAKSEAIKEFVEKFAKELSEFDMSSVGLPDYDRGYKDCMTAIEDTIDNLVQEMTEVEE